MEREPGEPFPAAQAHRRNQRQEGNPAQPGRQSITQRAPSVEERTMRPHLAVALPEREPVSRDPVHRKLVGDLESIQRKHGPAVEIVRTDPDAVEVEGRSSDRPHGPNRLCAA